MSSIITRQITSIEFKFKSIPLGFSLEPTTQMIMHIVKSLKNIYTILYDEEYYVLDYSDQEPVLDGRNLKIAVGEEYKFISNKPDSKTQYSGEIDIEESELYKLLKLDVKDATKIIADYTHIDVGCGYCSFELHINRLKVCVTLYDNSCRTEFYYGCEEYSDIYVIIKLFKQVLEKYFIISIDENVRLQERSEPINIFYDKLNDTIEISEYLNNNHDGEDNKINIIKQYNDYESENCEGPSDFEPRIDRENFY